jgi:hypothetical protein
MHALSKTVEANVGICRCASFTSELFVPTLHLHRESQIRSNPTINRMLEDPALGSVVRWSAEGDSFVVLEVRLNSKSDDMQCFGLSLTSIYLPTEREVYKDHPTETFQAQQLC